MLTEIRSPGRLIAFLVVTAIVLSLCIPWIVIKGMEIINLNGEISIADKRLIPVEGIDRDGRSLSFFSPLWLMLPCILVIISLFRKSCATRALILSIPISLAASEFNHRLLQFELNDINHMTQFLFFALLYNLIDSSFRELEQSRLRRIWGGFTGSLVVMLAVFIPLLGIRHQVHRYGPLFDIILMGLILGLNYIPVILLSTLDLWKREA